MSRSPKECILQWHSTMICNSYKIAIPRAELIMGSKQFSGTNLYSNALVGIKERNMLSYSPLPLPQIGCCKFQSKASIRILIR